jgi:hypothetical protein
MYKKDNLLSLNSGVDIFSQIEDDIVNSSPHTFQPTNEFRSLYKRQSGPITETSSGPQDIPDDEGIADMTGDWDKYNKKPFSAKATQARQGATQQARNVQQGKGPVLPPSQPVRRPQTEQPKVTIPPNPFTEAVGRYNQYLSSEYNKPGLTESQKKTISAMHKAFNAVAQEALKKL